MYSYGSPHTAAQKQDDQHERTFSSYVRIQVVVLKTYLGRWTIGRSGERGSGISVLPARYDDDDDITKKTMKFKLESFSHSQIEASISSWTAVTKKPNVFTDRLVVFLNLKSKWYPIGISMKECIRCILKSYYSVTWEIFLKLVRSIAK